MSTFINNMKEIIISRSKLAYWMKEHSLYLKKRFGQNFLFDKNVIDKIMKVVPFQGNDIIEIGPGIGNITHFYMENVNSVLGIEIDNGFYNFLQDSFQHIKKVSIIHSDFLKLPLYNYIDSNQQYIFFSNLPYSCASQILFKLLDYYPHIKELYIMLPDIYNDKLFSPHHTFKNKLGLILNIYFSIEKLFTIKKSCFFPEPEINSIFLKLVPHDKYLNQIFEPEQLQKKLTLLFSQKRKILRGVLIQAQRPRDTEAQKELSPYFNKRIDELKLEEIIELVNVL